MAATLSAANGLTSGSLSGSSAPLSGASRSVEGKEVTVPFADLMTDAVSEVNQLEDQAHVVVHGLMTGSGVDVHQAMISTEKASLAFELSLAVRNKAVQAYQQVMSMPF